MQVFKTFMKILKTRLTSAILYLVIFMVIAVIMADTAKDNNDYEDYKMSISVIDRDNSAESKRLQDFIFSGNKKVELADDEDEVIDAVYYGRSNYVLYINKDFGDKINAGDFDGLFENFKMPSSYGGQLFESRLERRSLKTLTTMAEQVCRQYSATIFSILHTLCFPCSLLPFAPLY